MVPDAAHLDDEFDEDEQSQDELDEQEGEVATSPDGAPQKRKAGRPPGVKVRGGKAVLFDRIENKAGAYFSIVDQYIRTGRKEDLKDRSATALKMLELRFGKAPTRESEDKGGNKKINAGLLSMDDLRNKHGKKEGDN